MSTAVLIRFEDDDEAREFLASAEAGSLFMSPRLGVLHKVRGGYKVDFVHHELGEAGVVNWVVGKEWVDEGLPKRSEKP